MDKAEQKRHEEQEREMLMRAAKSRSKTEDPEQAKLKAKVILFQIYVGLKSLMYKDHGSRELLSFMLFRHVAAIVNLANKK